REVELQRDPRPLPVVERLDRATADRPHRAVEAPEGERLRRVVLGDLVGHRHLPPAHAENPGRTRADLRRALGVDLPPPPRLRAPARSLPLAGACRVVEVGEDVLGAAVDLDRARGSSHQVVAASEVSASAATTSSTSPALASASVSASSSGSGGYSIFSPSG